MSGEMLKIPPLAVAKIRQLLAQKQTIEAALQQYGQGCLDTLLGDGDDKGKWIIDMDSMVFTRMEHPKDANP